MNADQKQAARAIESFLGALGLDPKGEPTLAGTGERVAKAFAEEICAGYSVDVDRLLEENRILAYPGATAVVMMRDIAVTTMCPHHLMPASGAATVAFAPGAYLVGLGALVGLIDAYAHRLTLQETIGENVVKALMAHVKPAWAGCRLSLSHMCVIARGERRHGARTETVSLAGDLEGSSRETALTLLGAGR